MPERERKSIVEHTRGQERRRAREREEEERRRAVERETEQEAREREQRGLDAQDREDYVRWRDRTLGLSRHYHNEEYWEWLDKSYEGYVTRMRHGHGY